MGYTEPYVVTVVVIEQNHWPTEWTYMMRTEKKRETPTAHNGYPGQRQPLYTHQEITLVYICRIRMRLYVIKSLNDIYMSNNF